MIVVGGGNTAMDCVRTSVRLGSPEVHCFYRRTEAEMPAEKIEIHEAREEGVIFDFLVAPVKVEKRGGKLVMTCRKMELGEPDASGRRRPVEKPDSRFELPLDTVIMAIGTSPNPLIRSTTPGLDTDRRGCIVTDEIGATSRPGVFAGGDAVTGAATVILAMGAGKEAAKAIDEYIQNK